MLSSTQKSASLVLVLFIIALNSDVALSALSGPFACGPKCVTKVGDPCGPGIGVCMPGFGEIGCCASKRICVNMTCSSTQYYNDTSCSCADKIANNVLIPKSFIASCSFPMDTQYCVSGYACCNTSSSTLTCADVTQSMSCDNNGTIYAEAGLGQNCSSGSVPQCKEPNVCNPYTTVCVAPCNSTTQFLNTTEYTCDSKLADNSNCTSDSMCLSNRCQYGVYNNESVQYCVPLPLIGQNCSQCTSCCQYNTSYTSSFPSNAPAPFCNITGGYICAESQVSSTVGSYCDVTAGLYCNYYVSYCDSVTKTCQPLFTGDVGTPCTGNGASFDRERSTCKPGLFCNTEASSPGYCSRASCDPFETTNNLVCAEDKGPTPICAIATTADCQAAYLGIHAKPGCAVPFLSMSTVDINGFSAGTWAAIRSASTNTSSPFYMNATAFYNDCYDIVIAQFRCALQGQVCFQEFSDFLFSGLPQYAAKPSSATAVSAPLIAVVSALALVLAIVI